MLKSSHRNSSGRRNFVAACATAFSVGVLYCSFDSVPAGEDVSVARTNTLNTFIQESQVPLPPEASTILDSATVDADADSSAVAQPAQPIAATEGGVLDSMDTLKFCTLMLQDGARFMENMSDYTIQFHKEERINGDMQAPQAIDMKVQHTPHFAVYMKWRTGDRGRQVLYSEEYDDGCMVVKFGGFKKILPALKVDPNCANAMAESRYPVTEAGILGMIRQILAYRERDLKRGHGVTCVRLADQEFDQRKCYTFLLKYDSPEYCKMYRKSIMMVDARYHIPVMMRNFTWAKDAEGLSEEELDKQTLIENYSFTNLNTSTKLASRDFSRENPRYRM